MNPIYPKNPKYYLFVFSSPLKQPIRITDSISFDYADLPYHLITSSPLSHGLPADTFSDILKHLQKVRRNSFLRVFSMKTNTPFLIMQHGGSGGMAENFPPLSPHVVFIFRASIFFEKSFRVQILI